MSSALDRHWTYVADQRRLAGYDRALSQVVTPGSVVADLGSGLGVLGLIAHRYHAKRVYAIERTGIIHTAGLIGSANGANALIAVHGNSTEVDLPEVVDIIVTDQMGPLGFEGGLRVCLTDAARRWLRPGGCVIPRTVRTFVAAAQVSVVRDRINRWATPQSGFDLSAVAALDQSRVHWVAREDVILLSTPAPLWTLETTHEVAPVLAGNAHLQVCRAGRFDGLVGWFEAELVAGVTLSNQPDSSTSIDRNVAVLPLPNPVLLREGAEIDARIRAVSPREILDWQVDILRAGLPRLSVTQNAMAYLMSERLT